MKAEEIVDDAMIRTAHEAYDAPGIWGRDEAMRAALLAVVPLFAERFAKIADGSIRAGAKCLSPMTATITTIDTARQFATQAHAGQMRKYTGEPYINHPAAVVAILETVGIQDDATIAAAWLHDVVEDCGVSHAEIVELFGVGVGELVFALTDCDLTVGNRKARKAIDRDRLARADPRAQTIKLADLIDNTGSIVERDEAFAVTYMREKAELLPRLTGGDSALWTRANALLVEYEQRAVEKWFGARPHA